MNDSDHEMKHNCQSGQSKKTQKINGSKTEAKSSILGKFGYLNYRIFVFVLFVCLGIFF